MSSRLRQITMKFIFGIVGLNTFIITNISEVHFLEIALQLYYCLIFVKKIGNKLFLNGQNKLISSTAFQFMQQEQKKMLIQENYIKRAVVRQQVNRILQLLYCKRKGLKLQTNFKLITFLINIKSDIFFKLLQKKFTIQ